MKCPRCQREKEAGAKFCEECALAGHVETAAVSSPQQPSSVLSAPTRRD